MSDDASALCLGKTPARPGATKLKFSAYLAGTKFPTVPADFGHEEYNPPIVWRMLGNDQYGDCVLAGGAHETMLWNKMAGRDLTFNTVDVLADQRAITGLPNSPWTGTDMQAAARYRQKYGLLGADSRRHKIGAYVALQPGNLRELYLAMYLFGAVGIGVAIHSPQRTQFQQHKAWAVAGGMFEGYHYVPAVALRSNIVVVTWGRFQAMRPSFYAAENDETLAYVSPEALNGHGKSPEGFDYAGLLADLQAITGV